MKWSNNTLIPTLKESPAEAEALSHKLMIRAGLIRKLASGIYYYLPLGYRVLSKVINIVRKHMNKAGAQELLLPALQPVNLWETSGRFELLGEDMFSFKDRHKNVMVLGPTHEEVITDLVKNEVKSYKQLPQILYQIQTKFRDEPRPRFGVVRSKEFIMKDAYSFDVDEEGLSKSYELMKKAYCDILNECGLDFVMVEADPGIMGGKQSSEFMIFSESGEDLAAGCDCGAAFNADAAAEAEEENAGSDIAELTLKEVSTPSKTTIEEVSCFLKITPDKLLKTIIYDVDGEGNIAVLIRGDHHVNETKLKKIVGTDKFRMADENTIKKLTNSKVGFSGPVGLSGVRIVADNAVKKMSNFVCGANKDDAHFVNVNLNRDFSPKEYADLRQIENGDLCPVCRKGKIKLNKAMEVGHIFKLGTRYTQAMGANYLDADQKEKTIIMGCYGLGINRLIAACIEQNHDEKGIKWPVSLSPYEVIISVLNPQDEAVLKLAEDVYCKLENIGVKDVLLDIRDERAGIKFNDADLIGFYLRVVISRRTLSENKAEIFLRKEGETKNFDINNIEIEIKKLLDKNRLE
ncbi:MAG: proline--tRNA ligase [Candidatus Omnitrophota bacterium]